MSYNHLTISERESILEYSARGLTIRAIALRLGRSASTISREMNRLSGHYSPSKYQADYRLKRQRCHKPRLLDQQTILCEKIVTLIKTHQWSPQQIASRMRLEGYSSVSYNTIYRHIERHNLNQAFTSHGDTGIRRNLRHRGRQRHRQGDRRHREPQVDYISIHERPNFINKRQRIGDWEIDTVQGKVGETVLVTAVDRKTRYTLITKAQRKDSQAVNEALITMFQRIPKEFVLSLTPDHGTEFLQLETVREQLGVTIYWPDPYSPEQRGTNENTNGLIREYFPKGQSLNPRTLLDISHCQWELNHRPKKILNYQTPEEILFDKVLRLV